MNLLLAGHISKLQLQFHLNYFFSSNNDSSYKEILYVAMSITKTKKVYLPLWNWPKLIYLSIPLIFHVFLLCLSRTRAQSIASKTPRLKHYDFTIGYFTDLEFIKTIICLSVVN